MVSLEAEPSVGFSMLLSQLRIQRGMIQKEAAHRLGLKSLYSYQKLVRHFNPSLPNLKKNRGVFPE